MDEKNNNRYCCQTFQYWLEDEDPIFEYDASVRCYTTSAPKCLLKKGEVWPIYRLIFCPWCGTKFPEELIKIRTEILKKG